MSILTAHTLISNSSHQETLYSLFINHMVSMTVITMKLQIPVVNTKYFPKTHSILSQKLPSIFFSKCFNDENLPFTKEVRSTEIGHLFEHILLDYLCIEKINSRSRNVVFNGHTVWDFNKDGVGVFHIHVDLSLGDKNLLTGALDKTIVLMNDILQSAALTLPTHKQTANDYLFADSIK